MQTYSIYITHLNVLDEQEGKVDYPSLSTVKIVDFIRLYSC